MSDSDKFFFCFPLPENIFIFSSFLKDTWNSIYCWQFFSFSIWKMLCPFLLYHFWWEMHFYSNCFPSLGKMFLSAFKIFPLSSVFRNLTMTCLGMDFFGFIPFEVCLSSWICRFTYFAKFGIFFFFSNQLLFLTLPSFPSFPRILMTLMFCYSPIYP